MKPAPSPSAAPARLQSAWQPWGELARGAGTLPPQMFLPRCSSMLEHCYFPSASFRQALPPCLTLTRFYTNNRLCCC